MGCVRRPCSTLVDTERALCKSSGSLARNTIKLERYPVVWTTFDYNNSTMGYISVCAKERSAMRLCLVTNNFSTVSAK